MSDSTYIALMVIMIFGWVLGIFICSPSRIRLAQLHAATETEKHNLSGTIKIAVRTTEQLARPLHAAPLLLRECLLLLPAERRERPHLQHPIALAEQLAVLDGPDVRRPADRRRPGRVLVVACHARQGRLGHPHGHRHDHLGRRIRVPAVGQRRVGRAATSRTSTYTDAGIATGPIFLYIFYGAYDALWQGFCCWLIGTQSNSAARAAVLVGAYKTFQATGGRHGLARQRFLVSLPMLSLA